MAGEAAEIEDLVLREWLRKVSSGALYDSAATVRSWGKGFHHFYLLDDVADHLADSGSQRQRIREGALACLEWLRLIERRMAPEFDQLALLLYLELPAFAGSLLQLIYDPDCIPAMAAFYFPSAHPEWYTPLPAERSIARELALDLNGYRELGWSVQVNDPPDDGFIVGERWLIGHIPPAFEALWTQRASADA